MQLNVLIFSILLMTTISSRSFAGDDDPNNNRKQLKANKISPDPPRLDGFLNDEVWQQAEFTSEFFQKDPN